MSRENRKYLTPEREKLIIKHYNPELTFQKNANKIVKLEGLGEGNSPAVMRFAISEYVSKLRDAKGTENIKEAFDFDGEITIDVPSSWYEERPTFEIPHGYNNTLLLGDVHIPYHDSTALKTALKHGKERGVDSIYINGDLMDFHSISFFSTKPKDRNFKGECDTGEVFLQMLRKHFPNAKIFYKLGNHEERLERFLCNGAGQLDDIITVESLLKTHDYGVEVIDGRRIVRLGKLFILHGHEIRVSSALVNIARTIRLRTSVNTIVNHHHKTQEDYNKDLADQVTGSWAVGCLCGLRPKYMPVNNWNHGFAIVESDRSMFKVHNYKIINGVVR